MCDNYYKSEGENMIDKGFCLFCGRRLDADPDRPNDGNAHDDCRKNLKMFKNLGITDQLVIEEILVGKRVLTTVEYWDCECHKNFIHPRAQKMCYECGAIEEEQPDSRIVEVMNARLPMKVDYLRVNAHTGNEIKNNYPNGLCPDCNEPIPDNVVCGQKCGNCGHVFY